MKFKNTRRVIAEVQPAVQPPAAPPAAPGAAPVTPGAAQTAQNAMQGSRLGELAEEFRTFVGQKFKATVPNLTATIGADGLITIRAVSQEANLQVTVADLNINPNLAQQQPPQAPAPGAAPVGNGVPPAIAPTPVPVQQPNPATTMPATV